MQKRTFFDRCGRSGPAQLLLLPSPSLAYKRDHKFGPKAASSFSVPFTAKQIMMIFFEMPSMHKSLIRSTRTTKTTSSIHLKLPSSLFFLLLLPLLMSVAHASAHSRNSAHPFGLSAEVFSKQAFDENAPFCKPEREPCGFYDLSLDGNTQLDWVKSWCRCPARHECAFDEPDMRHKVYRFVCKKEQPKQRQSSMSSSSSLQGTVSQQVNRNRLVVRRHGRRRSAIGGTTAGGGAEATNRRRI